ncbi:MAG: VirB3 family type IV secretion system protein [Rickettsia sp.]|nr:VirB3 family type IV secretion system protein [Rickettsia sp.]
MSEYFTKQEPVFLGLTKPNLIFGVSMHFVMLNMMISIVIFIQSSDFRVAFLSAILHGVGYYVSFKESRFLEIYMKHAQKCNFCSNRMFYDGNSYYV